MFNHTQQITLKASLKEFWNFNRNFIMMLPVLILFFYAILILSPGKLLFKNIFHPSLVYDNEYLIQQIDHGFGGNRILILLTVILILVLCTHNYLTKIKNQTRYTTMPIPDSYRISTLWLYTVFILLTGCITLYLIDHSSVMIFKHYYLEQVLHAKEELGILYPKAERHSYFTSVPLEYYLGISLGILFFLPLFHLTYFLFKKRSLLYSFLLYLLILSICTYSFTHVITTPTVTVIPEGLGFVRPSFLLLFAIINIIAFKYALKEREV